MGMVSGRGGLSPFYCCFGKLLLFGKVEHLRYSIFAHYSLVRAWLLNVWDVYVARSAVQTLPLRRTWVNSLQGRRRQEAPPAGRQESTGLETWFSCLSQHGNSSSREKKGQCSTLCQWERSLQGSWRNKCAEKSKSQRERGRKWRKRRGKVRKLSSPVLAAENAAVFLNLLFFRLWRKSSKVAGDKVKHLLQDNSNIKKHKLCCVITN